MLKFCDGLTFLSDFKLNKPLDILSKSLYFGFKVQYSSLLFEQYYIYTFFVHNLKTQIICHHVTTLSLI